MFIGCKLKLFSIVESFWLQLKFIVKQVTKPIGERNKKVVFFFLLYLHLTF
jgi:hypothetical protein